MELINRETLVEWFRETYDSDERILRSSVVSAIKNAPAEDAAPVVRCGECKHRKRPYGGGPIVRCGNPESFAYNRRAMFSDFCSKGAKMDAQERAEGSGNDG